MIAVNLSEVYIISLSLPELTKRPLHSAISFI